MGARLLRSDPIGSSKRYPTTGAAAPTGDQQAEDLQRPASQRASLQERGPSFRELSSPDRRFSGNARGRPGPCPPPRASPPPASRW